MDEAITCKCGSQDWVIGTSGTRCAKCTWFLPREWIKADVVEINKKIEALGQKGE